MNVSKHGREFITREEGLRLKSYLDSVNIWTIGVGHTGTVDGKKIVRGMTITKEKADILLAQDLRWVEDCLNRTIKVKVNQYQFDALASLVFNIGSGAFIKSSVLRRLNESNYAQAAENMLLYKNAGGRPILLNRRKREKVLFETK